MASKTTFAQSLQIIESNIKHMKVQDSEPITSLLHKLGRYTFYIEVTSRKISMHCIVLIVYRDKRKIRGIYVLCVTKSIYLVVLKSIACEIHVCNSTRYTKGGVFKIKPHWETVRGKLVFSYKQSNKTPLFAYFSLH